MSTLNLDLVPINNTSGWSHRATSSPISLDDNVEMAVCEVKIFNYFLFLETDHYITLAHYHGRVYKMDTILRYENQYLQHKGNPYELSSAVRIKIPAGYYKSPEELKQYLLYRVRHIVRDAPCLSEWFIGSDHQSQALYYKEELFESPKEFSFNYIDLNFYISLINRLSYIKNNLSFIEDSDDAFDQYIFALYVDETLVKKLNFVGACSIIPPEGSNLTSPDDLNFPGVLKGNLNIYSDIQENTIVPLVNSIAIPLDSSVSIPIVLPEYHKIKKIKNNLLFNIETNTTNSNFHLRLHFRRYID